jgi:tRNA G18 (ribose-2'-O)-methylase SpoU
VIQPQVPAEYAHVGDAVWLRAHGLFVAEGRLVVRRLIEAGRYELVSVVVTRPAFESLADVCRRAPCPVHVVERSALASLTGYDFHRGCLALAKRPGAQPPLEAFAGASRLMALESVANPDNVGGLFRLAAAFETAGMVLDRGSGDPLYRKAIRTSMGASLDVPFTRLDSWPSALGRLRGWGFEIAALTPDRAATPLAEYAATFCRDRPVVLLLGAEGSGLTPAAVSIADVRVRIPIAAGVDSLNVVVAAGIALATLGQALSFRR